MAHSARHIYFSGRVQGVGFRFTARRIALNYGLSGFVRNLADGRVEMLIQGSEADIDNCLKDINRAFDGYIKNTEVTQKEPDPRYTDFQIRF